MLGGHPAHAYRRGGHWDHTQGRQRGVLGSDLYIRTYAATWPLQDAANDAAGDWWESDTTEDGVLGLDTHAGNYCTVSPTDPTYPLAITTKDVLQRSGCNGMRALPPPTPMEHSSKTRSGWPHPGRA